MKSTCGRDDRFLPPSELENAVFEQSNEAAPESQEVRGTNRKLLQEFVQLADRAQFGRNIQQLMKFVGLGAGRAVKLGVGHGHRGKTGDHRNQRFLLVGENAFLPRIDEDSALADSRCEREQQSASRRDQVAKSVGDRIDGNGDGLIGGQSLGWPGRRQIAVPCDQAGTDRSCQLRRLGGHGAQTRRRCLRARVCRPAGCAAELADGPPRPRLPRQSRGRHGELARPRPESQRAGAPRAKPGSGDWLRAGYPVGPQEWWLWPRDPG